MEMNDFIKVAKTVLLKREKDECPEGAAEELMDDFLNDWEDFCYGSGEPYYEDDIGEN